MRNKMSREDRAKQFMPFAALRGYEEALRAKEKIVVDKKELSEERKAELDEMIQIVKKQDIVTVVYFEKDEYLKITGMISKLDMDSKYIQVVGNKISFENIFSIVLVQQNLFS